MNLSTEDGGHFSFASDPLIRLDGPDGEWLYDEDATSDHISISYDLDDLDDVQCRVNIGDRQVRARQVFAEYNDSSVTSDGLKYLAFGGLIMNILLDPVNGDNVYLPEMMQFKREASEDGNSGILATVYHTDATPIDDSLGDVQLVGGRVLDDFAQALLVDTDIDFTHSGVQSVANVLTSIRREVVAYGVGAELTAIIVFPASPDQQAFLDSLEPGEEVTLDDDDELVVVFSRVAGTVDTLYLIGDHHVIGDSLTVTRFLDDTSTTFDADDKQTVETAISATGHWAVRQTSIPGFMIEMSRNINTSRDHARATNSQTQQAA